MCRGGEGIPGIVGWDDRYYPTWHAVICGMTGRESNEYPTWCADICGMGGWERRL